MSRFCATSEIVIYLLLYFTTHHSYTCSAIAHAVLPNFLHVVQQVLVRHCDVVGTVHSYCVEEVTKQYSCGKGSSGKKYEGLVFRLFWVFQLQKVEKLCPASGCKRADSRCLSDIFYSSSGTQAVLEKWWVLIFFPCLMIRIFTMITASLYYFLFGTNSHLIWNLNQWNNQLSLSTDLVLVSMAPVYTGLDPVNQIFPINC